MKKLLAILLGALMLLSAFAVAEGGSVTLGNVQISANGQMMVDLRGLELELAAAQGDGGMGVRIALDYDGKGRDEVIGWLSDAVLALKASFLSNTYCMDLEEIGQMVGSDLSPETAGDLLNQIPAEDMAAVMSIAVAAQECFQTGVTDGGEAEIDGARYAVTSIEITEAQTGKVMDAVFALLDNHPEILSDSEFSSFSELRQAVNPQLSASGSVYTGDAGCLVDVTLSVSAAMLPEPAKLKVYAEQKAGDAGDAQQLHIELAVDAMDQNGTLSLDVALAADDGAWIPAQVGDAVNVMSVLGDSAQQQKLVGEATAFAMRLMASVAGILQQNAAA